MRKLLISFAQVITFLQNVKLKEGVNPNHPTLSALFLVVNMVRTDPSAKFICYCWSSPWCDFHVSHAPKCKEPAKIRAN